MFHFSQRNSEHDDLYDRLKLNGSTLKEQSDEVKDGSDPYASIKEGYHLSKDYEIYLETEKKRIMYNKKLN